MVNSQKGSLSIFILVTVIGFLCSIQTALADCGNIIDVYQESTPIENCDNPFNADTSVFFTYSLTLNDQAVTNNTTINLDLGQSVNGFFNITDTAERGRNSSGEPLNIFKVEGQDYHLVTTERQNNFTLNTLPAGQYVAVFIYEIPPMLSRTKSNWLTYLKKLFLPNTTYAYYPDYKEVVAINFTVTETPTLTGASSVLFLPGLMGSRLYEESAECDPDGIVREQERWVSRDDCDHQRLETNFIGQSKNNIYTKEGENGLVDEVYVFNIYKTFLTALKTWKNDEVINDYAVAPYDWRLQLDKILKAKEADGVVRSDLGTTVEEGYLYQTITNLAEHSKNGKVTIVAHSNGGLVIKQLLVYLKNHHDPLLDKIDNLILVAVPQLGTPNSLIGILHGEAVGPAGFMMTQSTSRQLTKTLPFSHHLLPSQTYFNTVQTPVLKFEAGSSTDYWKNTYGPEITDAETLYNFMDKNSGRVEPDEEDLATPEIVDRYLIDNYAQIIDLIQGDWQPPATMKVYQLAGTGLETPAGLTYFTDRECLKRSILKAFLCSEYGPKLGYRVDMVLDGDAVVVAPSALTVSGGERWWLNLLKHNNDGLFDLNANRQHKDILEVSDVINFVGNTIQGTSSLPYLYLSTTSPELPNLTRLVFQLHSPLDMSLVTTDGREVSSSTNTIKGATYRRYGELQYLSIPEIEKDATLLLQGLATGSFTLEIEEKNNNTTTNKHTYSAVPSSTSTKVTMDLSEIEDYPLAVDYEGDGKVDVVYNAEGVVEEEITYEDLFRAIDNLVIKTSYQRPLLLTAKLAEAFHKKSLTKIEKFNLSLLIKQVAYYEKKKIISPTEKQELEQIITGLLDK